MIIISYSCSIVVVEVVLVVVVVIVVVVVVVVIVGGGGWEGGGGVVVSSWLINSHSIIVIIFIIIIIVVSLFMCISVCVCLYLSECLFVCLSSHYNNKHRCQSCPGEAHRLLCRQWTRRLLTRLHVNATSSHSHAIDDPWKDDPWRSLTLTWPKQTTWQHYYTRKSILCIGVGEGSRGRRDNIGEWWTVRLLRGGGERRGEWDLFTVIR